MSRSWKCKFCGKEIGIINYGVYRKAVVDPDVVMVVPEAEGEDFVRVDGSKVRGRPAAFEERGEPAYRLHRATCGREA